ncbi:xylosidase [Chryseobacterium sp. RG1]|uniref:Xylosidase n=1 Tax=Chryseobacterium tagetis TaxID=2801334 RepID=A0ABS8A5M2_9FLAO|nr:glycoside hydrolase family 71/99-like protein [Chryseobacterium tagetis]MCA6069132.1 xylosidase [Chryseobacterium tagetis]
MTGYQGWFAAEGDSANIGWYHYAKDWKLDSKVSKFDMWPDTKEYKKTYKTKIIDKEGKPTYLFSSNDASTSELHVKWMRDYGIDGAFIQRFFLALWDGTRQHHIKVLLNMMKYGDKYGRAMSVMYDIGGIKTENDADKIIEDWKFLVDNLKITSSNGKAYLFNNNKPVVGLIIVGLNDSETKLSYIDKIMNFLKNDKKYGNCSIVLGVPYFWRTLNGDSVSDPQLHSLVKKADYIMPWSVGRVRYDNFSENQKILIDDLEWCKKNKLEYLPVIYPGFSWHNLKNSEPMNQIPRKSGAFYQNMINNVEKAKVKNVYVAMFDEIDEGTAIFKISKNPPDTGFMRFVAHDKNIPEDYYLKLTGQLAKELKK